MLNVTESEPHCLTWIQALSVFPFLPSFQFLSLFNLPFSLCSLTLIFYTHLSVHPVPSYASMRHNIFQSRSVAAVMLPQRSRMNVHTLKFSELYKEQYWVL